jgi:hypothetical protein
MTPIAIKLAAGCGPGLSGEGLLSAAGQVPKPRTH